MGASASTRSGGNAAPLRTPTTIRNLYPSLTEDSINKILHESKEMNETDAVAAIIAWTMSVRKDIEIDPAETMAVKERRVYDKFMCAHLLRHTTFASVAITLKAACVFSTRAQQAKKTINDRRAAGSMSHAAVEAATGSRSISREDKISTGQRLMSDRLSFLKLDIMEMDDDGNCQFRAISHELFGNQNSHQYVRNKVVLYLREHCEEYAVYVGDEEEWKAYIQSMSMIRTWGDELTLTAAAKAFNVMVNVISTEEQNWLLRYGGETPADMNLGHEPVLESRRELFLAYISPIHYNVVCPRWPE